MNKFDRDGADLRLDLSPDLPHLRREAGSTEGRLGYCVKNSV